MFSSIQRIVAASLSLAVLIVNVNGQTPTCARTYTVKEGDYCDAISAANNASTYQLAQANVGVINSDCSNLQVDQVICLGLTGQDCTQVYVVVSGDGCYSIAQGAGITSAALLAANPNINSECTNIYPGEVLCVGSSA